MSVTRSHFDTERYLTSHTEVTIIIIIEAVLPERGPQLGELAEAIIRDIGALGHGELPQPRAIHGDTPDPGI